MTRVFMSYRPTDKFNVKTLMFVAYMYRIMSYVRIRFIGYFVSFNPLRAFILLQGVYKSVHV